MPRYRVDPRTTKSIEMKDGTRYRVPASGVVSVSHRHEDEMRRSPTLEGNVNGGMIGLALAMPGGTGPTCERCAFVGWPWQTECPRCERPLI